MKNNTLPEFQEFLRSRSLVHENYIPFYAHLKGLNSLNGLNYIKIMKITHYSFGSITIDGKTYTSDVIIYPDRVNSSWWRKEGHFLQIADLTDIVSVKLPVLIIGTGFYGTMRVPEETIDYLKSNGIEAYIENTQKAVKLYTEISFKKPTIAALHLTC